MKANFFDIKANWNLLESNFKNEEFIKAINMYHWWGFKEEIGTDLPLIETERFSRENYSEESYKDVIYVQNRLAENYHISNPYWFCYPGDCVELNSIIMYQLLKLTYPNKKWYVAEIHLNNEHNFHLVIIDKPINESIFVDFDIYAEESEDTIMIYDLIYFLMPWYGKTFETRESVNSIRIDQTIEGSDYWKSMNYISYFDKH